MSWFDKPLGPRFRGDDQPAVRSNFARWIVVLVLSGGLVACGFHLRGEAKYAFSSIFVNVTGAPVFESGVKRALDASGSAKVAKTPTDAQVILDIPPISDEKDVLSLSGGGSVREYALLMRVSFRLHDADGLDWLPPGEIVVRRSYTFNETEVLARDAEEQRLLREMQGDAIAQLIRRLQAAKNPA
jgi:LPS-assembly lipoprotein